VGGGAYIYFGGGGGNGTLTNAAGAKLNLSSSHGTPLHYYGYTATFNNAGTLNQTVAGDHAIHSSVAFSNTGIVNGIAGALMITSSGTDTGTYSAVAGAAVGFIGGTRNLNAGTNFSGAGSIYVWNSTVNVNVAVNLPAGGMGFYLSNGGTLNFNNTATIGSLYQDGGTVSGLGAVTVLGNYTVRSQYGQSNLTGSGTFTTLGATTINLTPGNSYLGLSKNWINQGTLTVGGDDFIYFGYPNGGNNTLTNAVGGTLNLSSTYATPIQYYTGTATINNAGTLNQTVTGDHAIGANITFNNTGTVNGNAGQLQINGNGIDSGLYNAGMFPPRAISLA
ncbi:MAG: hypothetical protein K9J74_13095, partial [Sulfuritalea sp.]|nr:hypothetical protein [Sulfuritalea sp.]